jgi:hypothetical protein
VQPLSFLSCQNTLLTPTPLSVLSSSALDALKEFYADRDARQQQFEDLRSAAEKGNAQRQQQLSMEAFAEDWNESQFWVLFPSPLLDIFVEIWTGDGNWGFEQEHAKLMRETSLVLR